MLMGAEMASHDDEVPTPRTRAILYRGVEPQRAPRAPSPEHEHDKHCRYSPRRERIQREREKAQRVEDAKPLSARLVRARTPPRAGRASLEVRHMVRTNGLPGAAGHPDTKPEMDHRQRARMNKILSTMSAFSQLAIEEAEAVLAEANAEREWDDVKQAKADLAEARQSGDERLIAKMKERLSAEKLEAEDAQIVAERERQEAEDATKAVAEAKRLALLEDRGGKAKPPGAAMPGRPGRASHWVSGDQLSMYYAEERSAARLAALMRIVSNDPSLTSLDWAKKDVHDGVVQQLAHALSGNTCVRRVDLRFNMDLTDLACGWGKARVSAAAASLERMLPHTEVIRLELVGTGVSGFKSSALHAICRANSIRAVARDDPTLRLLDWDAMRVDDTVMQELAQALRTNTTLRALRVGRNRHLTDEGIDALDTALSVVGCNVTEVTVGDSTGVSAAKVVSLGQSIDVRRLRVNDPDMTELVSFSSYVHRFCTLF